MGGTGGVDSPPVKEEIILRDDIPPKFFLDVVWVYILFSFNANRNLRCHDRCMCLCMNVCDDKIVYMIW